MDGGPPRFGPGFTCPALLRDRVAPSGLGSRTGLSPAAAGPPMPFRSPAGPAPGGGSPRMRGPATPSAEPLPGMPARRFGHRSPFARRYLGNRCFFLFLRLLRCFSSPGSPPYVMDWRMDDTSSSYRVSPFRHLRIKDYLHLPAAFRSLSRLSSALSAKASTLRSSLLNLFDA